MMVGHEKHKETQELVWGFLCLFVFLVAISHSSLDDVVPVPSALDPMLGKPWVAAQPGLRVSRNGTSNFPACEILPLPRRPHQLMSEM
ncbi:MAG: hypothetical protein AAF989_05935 [Planctomycetota bacterium]